MPNRDKHYVRPSEPVSVEIDGVAHHGEFRVHDGMITVGTVEFGSKRTQLGNSARHPATLARMLLRELVQAGQK